MLERELKRLGDRGPGGGRAVGLGGVDGVDPADVVQVEAPELNGGGREEAAGEELLDLVEEAVRELELAVLDPLLRLRDAEGL